jgi:hypothetical protein
VWVLVQDCGSDVRLEESGTDSEHVEGESEGTDSMAALDNAGDGGDDHDHVGNTTNGDSYADGFESPQFGICEPSSKDGTVITC